MNVCAKFAWKNRVKNNLLHHWLLGNYHLNFVICDNCCSIFNNYIMGVMKFNDEILFSLPALKAVNQRASPRKRPNQRQHKCQINFGGDHCFSPTYINNLFMGGNFIPPTLRCFFMRWLNLSYMEKAVANGQCTGL